MKYVIIENDGAELAILFPECMPHETFASKHPISAGFVTLITEHDQMKIFVRGESRGLGLKSRHNEDIDIIRHSINFEGI